MGPPPAVTTPSIAVARNQVLLREVSRCTAPYQDVALQGADRGKCPAGTACTLISYGRTGPKIAPVESVGKDGVLQVHGSEGRPDPPVVGGYQAAEFADITLCGRVGSDNKCWPLASSFSCRAVISGAVNPACTVAAGSRSSKAPSNMFTSLLFVILISSPSLFWPRLRKRGFQSIEECDL